MGIKNRQETILNLLQDKGGCSYKELEKLLNVSNMTVRRDIDRLANEGRVIKTLGGVQKANAPSEYYETSPLLRISENQEQKKDIAEKALEYIEPNTSIYLDGGTTCWELAKLLAKKGIQLTVVTNSQLVCQAIGESRNIVLIMIGGRFDPDTYCCVGTNENGVPDFFVDKAIVSSTGFLPSEGTFESAVATFQIKQKIVNGTNEIILLADSSKFGQRALCKVLDISQIDTVITDSIEKTNLESLEKAGIKVLIPQKELSEVKE